MSNTKTYKWRPGSRVNRTLAPETVASELDRIREEEGVLTPKLVVDEARPKSAPLHPSFEWNNGKAAEQYREWQARQLIAAVLVVYPDQQTSRAYIHVSAVATDEEEGETTGSYEAISVVVADDEMLRKAVAELIVRIESARSALANVEREAGKVNAKSIELRELQEIATALSIASAIANRRKA